MTLKEIILVSGENKISSNNMTKALKHNIAFLEGMLAFSKPAVRNKVKNLVDLYKDRKISNVTTATKMADKLRTITPKTEKRVFKQYEKLISKYENNEPLNVRMQKSKEAKKEKVAQASRLQRAFRAYRAQKQRLKSYLVNVLLFSHKPAHPKQKPYKGVYLIKEAQYEVKVNKQFPEELVKVLVKVDEDKPLFTKGFDILMTDENFKDFINNQVSAGVTAFKFLSYDSLKDGGKKYDPLDEGLLNADNASCNFRYIHTAIRLDSKTFMESITNERYTKNECWINSITDFYGDTLMSATRKRNVLTRQKLLTVLNKTEETVKQGLSVKDVLPFFKEYKLNLRVFDVFGKLLCRHDPETKNHHNKTMFCMVKGNHVYTLNYDLKTLDQKLNAKPEFCVKATSDYFLREEKETPYYKMIAHVDDLLSMIKNTMKEVEEKKEKVVLNLIYLGDRLTELLYQIKNAGYDPAIKYDGGKLTQIGLTLGHGKQQIIVLIKTQQLAPSENDGECNVPTAEIYNSMATAMNKFHGSLFKQQHMSYYSKQDVDILDEYRTVVPIGVLKDADTAKIEIDVSKAFTFAFSKISEIPIFNEFDSFKVYNNEAIALNNLYVVKAKVGNLFFNKTFNLCYGKFLKKFKDVEVLAVKHPSFVKNVNYNKIVEDLYKTTISEDDEMDKYCKKLVANVNCGLLEKSTNKAQKSKLFNTLGEARYHQAIYGGRISILKKFHEQTVEEVHPLDFGLDDVQAISSTDWIEDETKYFILTVSDSANLKNGFRYIKELLLQHHNYKMYKDYNALITQGVEVFSVKTDAFTIKPEDLEIATSCLHFSTDIGGWRHAKDDDIKLPSENYQYKFNTEIPITRPAFERVELLDEWDADEMCRIFEEKKRVIVRAHLPGSGKSYACEQMRKRGYKVLFVCPTKKLVQKNEDAVTINKFFSIGINPKAKMAKFDAGEYDVIVFDEIVFYDVPWFARIHRYCLDNPNKIVVATGDTCQLPPINALTDQGNAKEYSDYCINQIFKYEIYLHENKRLKKREDREKLKQIKEDTFNENIPLMDTITKYFKFTTDITQSENNIAYMNDTCKEVAKHRRKKLGKVTEYEVGEFLICRDYFKVKQIVFNVNFEYEIISVGPDSLDIRSVCSQEITTVPLKMIRSHFIFNYCGTCHSQQGASIDTCITIFDYKHFFVSREWIWVSITRATDLDNVYFYDYTFDEELNKNLIRTYFERKVKNYKSQDRDAGREISKENYVDTNWLMKAVNKRCFSCQCDFFISFDTGNTFSNITADRVNCSSDHNIFNIVPMCRWCNTSKSDKDSTE